LMMTDLIGSTAARADTLARFGRTLFRTRGAMLFRSDDDATSFHRVREFSGEDDDGATTIRALAPLGEALLIGTSGGILVLTGAEIRRVGGEPCEAFATAGSKAAALCAHHLFISTDGGLNWTTEVRPNRTRSITFREGQLYASDAPAIAGPL